MDDKKQKESKNSLPLLEEKILSFWGEKHIPEQNLNAKRNRQFIFYEGPPTANAGPGFHHVIARVFKDIIPRYKFLKGFAVPRKAGWDTHGLPVELQIEKEIGTRTKSDIEKYGLAAFNRKCQESVWRFKQEWDKFTERIGFWLDLEHSYITYDPHYMESVWWLLKKIWQKGLLKQDYKVVPYCARCGTPLSSHEVAQGYEDVEETSVYLKFKILNTGNLSLDVARDTPKNRLAYFLVWTTTPWTLPGNVALAVNPAITYVYTKLANGETYLLAENRLAVFQESYEVTKRVSGKDLVGLRYEPLFPYLQNKNITNIQNAFQVLPADFATDEEGTGIVHIAVMYGEDDFKLGKQFNLPEYHLVGPDGKFTKDVSAWQEMWVKDADPKIIESLRQRGVLYKTEPVAHTYPFCWRCHTPLLYYAHQSWFIMMSQLRDKLLKNNKQVHWEPEHLQEGRFGEWLREVKDWALSRDRYWGTPLPVWQCEANKEHQIAVGSLNELTKRAWQPNTYYLMRHGEATSNVKSYNAGWPEKQGMVSELTEKGKKQMRRLAHQLKKENIDYIVASDLTRIKQTLELLEKELTGAKVRFDPRLREVNFGELNYKPFSEFKNLFWGKRRQPLEEIFVTKANGGESPQEVEQRVFAAVIDLEKEFRGKKILIITHGLPLWVLSGKLRNLSLQETYKLGHPKNAELRQARSLNFPYNEKQEVDLHRPFIDEVFLTCDQCGSQMRRVPQVIDCWFDAGAMPYAQHHFPFAFLKKNENPDTVNYQRLLKKVLPFPADYIAEAVDQTRGWFYTLLAISTAMDLGPSYRSVVCLGHVLDEKGEKMSKSKSNVVDPWQMIEKYGVDALRWYFYTVNSPGEYKKFAERDLNQSASELMVVLNVLNFFKMYVPEGIVADKTPPPTTVLEKWVQERVRQTAVGVSKFLESNKIFEASRTLEALFDDISRWYLRRSRSQFQKPESEKSLHQQSAFLGYILLDLARLMAPFTPFLAEQIWITVNSQLATRNSQLAQSVHLDKWPEEKPSAQAEKLFKDMVLVRSIAAAGLALRAQASIKVRQPLATLFIQSKKKVLPGEFLAIVKDEVNVKTVLVVEKIPESEAVKVINQENLTIGLDTHIDAELRAEGDDRELMRQINEARQEQGCAPADKVRARIPKALEPEGFSDNLERLRKVQGATNSIIVVSRETERIEIEKVI